MFLIKMLGFIYFTAIIINNAVSEITQEELKSTRAITSIHQITTQEPFKPSEDTRRILKGTLTGDIRPYMVYLKAATSMKKKQAERMSAKKKKKNQSKSRLKRVMSRQKARTDLESDHKYWLCGGVIVHAEYVITSAACIEDVKQFYVISGTSKWNAEDSENSCASNGALRATWKCVDQDFHYDGNNYDNIQWMKHDIAVVRVERPFNFTHKVLGCDFIPQKIVYNNYSADFEKTGNVGTIAGWGSTSKFFTSLSDFKEEEDDQLTGRNMENSTAAQAVNPDLLETEVKIMSKRNCKKVWDTRYHEVIDGDIICSRDVVAGRGAVCDEVGAKCVDIVYSEEDDEYDGDENVRLRTFAKKNQTKLLNTFLQNQNVDVRRQNDNHTRRVQDETVFGGFCENDHGGPLIVGNGKKALVVGIMTAAYVKAQTRECRGPFLYTSVFKHSDLINCAINKQSLSCKNPGTGTLRTKEIAFDWDI